MANGRWVVTVFEGKGVPPLEQGDDDRDVATRNFPVASGAAWKGDSDGPEVAPLSAGLDLREAYSGFLARAARLPAVVLGGEEDAVVE